MEMYNNTQTTVGSVENGRNEGVWRQPHSHNYHCLCQLNSAGLYPQRCSPVYLSVHVGREGEGGK